MPDSSPEAITEAIGALDKLDELVAAYSAYPDAAVMFRLNAKAIMTVGDLRAIHALIESMRDQAEPAEPTAAPSATMIDGSHSLAAESYMQQSIEAEARDLPGVGLAVARAQVCATLQLAAETRSVAKASRRANASRVMFS